MPLPRLLRFPNPVNEVAARLVAAGVVLQAAAFLITRWPVFLVTLAVGFVLRVLAGPRFSPLALLVTRVVVPRLAVPEKQVPGPPKRFAQGIGATLSVAAVAAWAAGAAGLATLLVGMILVAATLEAALAFCLGCRVFALLMRAGIIPADVCVACGDLADRLAASTAGAGGTGAAAGTTER